MHHKTCWAGNKVSRRNINNFRHADAPPLWETKEELKSLSVMVRGEWKSWLKTRHSKNEDHGIRSHQLSSVTQSCLTLCDPMNGSAPALPVHHQCSESTQTHVHWVGDAIQPLILRRPLLLLPSIFPSITVFSNGSWQTDGETVETVTAFHFLGSIALYC